MFSVATAQFVAHVVRQDPRLVQSRAELRRRR